jgi:hydroxylaminobenzene mutase
VKDAIRRRFLIHGLIVFLLGLVAGLAILGPPGMFKSPRLALSSHLVGVTGGMFVVIAGLMLDHVRLSARESAVLFWLATYGAYGNWGGSFLAGVFGTQTMTTIASSGAAVTSPAWQEVLVGVTLTTSGTATLAACLLLLWGLRSTSGGKDL